MEVEFALNSTGNRIDDVLRDKAQKFVTVEVEVEFHQCPLAGSLQLMKCRAMRAYYFERSPKEARCIRASHTIAPEVDAHCAAYEIEMITMAKPFGLSTCS